MTVRNGEAYLSECLDSILNQSIQDWELCVVNNQSSDATGKILEKYHLLDQRVNVVDYKGVSEIIPALRAAYKASSGDYITRMDADDLMPKEKLCFLRDELLKKGRGFVATGLVHYFSNTELGDGYKKYETWLNELTQHSSNYSQIYKECVIPSPCWMVHHDDFEKCGAFSSDVYPEDYDLCFRFYENNMKVIGINEVLHYWRDYNNRNSRTDPNYADQLFFDLKLHYFLKVDHKVNLPLIVWGAGRKGKLMAKKLIDLKLQFDWVTDNPKKIGHNIYGIILKNVDLINYGKQAQVIVAISGEEQSNVIRFLEQRKVKYYLFC